MALNNHKKELRNPAIRDGKHLIGPADNKAPYFRQGPPAKGIELVEAAPRLQSDSSTLVLRTTISCPTAAAGQSAAHLDGSGHACATGRAALRAHANR